MRFPKAKPAPHREQILYDDRVRKLMDLLFLSQGRIRITILKNIVFLTHALLTLFHGARGANGWLSPAAPAMGILRLSLPRFSQQAHTETLALLQILATGKGLIA